MAQNMLAKIGSRLIERREQDGAAANVPAVVASNLPGVPRARYAEFLPDLEAIAEREHSPFARWLALASLAIFVVMFAWASLAKIDQVVTAPGNVRPAGKVKVINHPDGGIVAALFVHDGDHVKEGDKLLELDARVTDEEIARLRGEYQSLSFEIARLEADIAGQPLALPPELVEARPDLAAEQQRQYAVDQRSLAGLRGVGTERVSQAKSAVAGSEKKVTQLEEGVKISREQDRVLSELVGKGYFPKLRYLDVKRQLTNDEGALAQAKDELSRAQAAVAEAERAREQAEADFSGRESDRLSQARTDQGRAYRGLKEQEARRASLLITAPVAGIVQNSVVASAGQSVQPNAPIMNVVPTGDTLVVEARVSNNDIGYITVGQSASVKVDTYPYVKYGMLEGKVESIAADATRDDKSGQSYFTVYVRTTRTYLGKTPEEQPVNPGMQTTVDLKTGRRSVIAYLTDRFRQKVTSAFREP